MRRRGARRGTVDIKSGATLQLTGAARVAALSLGVRETNTVDRFRTAAARGLYTDAEAREITDAYQYLMRLRLLHHLARIAAGIPPDNDVDPSTLPRADALLLRDALRTVQSIQASLRERFATDLLG